MKAVECRKVKRRAPGIQVLQRQPVALNLGKVIRFVMGDVVLERRLVLTAFQPTEISTASPVGRKLADAEMGQEFTVNTPEGALVVKVLSILMTSVPQEAAG